MPANIRAGTLQVKGYKEFLRAVATADAATKREVRGEIRKAGGRVRAEAERRFGVYGTPDTLRSHAQAGHGYRVVVRQRGVAVEQSQRRTTGKHPEYGRAQMRHALSPALGATRAQFERDIERVFDRIAARFNANH